MRLGLLKTSLLFVMSASLVAAPVFAQSHGPHGAPPHPTAAAPAATHRAPVSVAQHIEMHPALATRLQPLVPPGMTLAQAAQGFRNQGQFIAALHVSRNLGIPFAQLKAEMTGADRDSLGQAIHSLRPTANAKLEAKKANTEAREDLKTVRKDADRDTDRDDR